MKRTIIVVVVEDDKYYNSLLSKALKESIPSIQQKHNCKLVINSFTDSSRCIHEIKTNEMFQHDIIAFVDYYLGKGINGNHIIRLLKKQNNDSKVVLLSQSKVIQKESNFKNNIYTVIKDPFTPSLCCLYLEQFIDDKFS